MPIIKQTNVLEGTPSTYRIKRVDGQIPKPYPKWKYTWILPDGVDAEFKSDSTGYPMVIVQWNEISAPGSPFSLICQVETDVVDDQGIACISIVQIDVNVNSNIVNLTTTLSGATGQCVQIGTTGTVHDYQYIAECEDAIEIWWDALNGLFRESGNLESGPLKKIPNGSFQSNVFVNWLPGSLHNISAYGIDSSGNVSNKVILQTYPFPLIDSQIIGVESANLDGNDVIIIFKVNNIKQYDPNFYITYNIYIGKYNGSGDVNDDSNYTWTVQQPVTSKKISTISNNYYSVNYIIDGSDLSTMKYRFKFNPVVTSNYDPTCYTERDQDESGKQHNFEWIAIPYVPIFPTAPTATMHVAYTPIFLTYALHGNQPTGTYVVEYIPTFIYMPTGYNTTGISYIPIFPTAPTFSRGVTYSPTWINIPISDRKTEYIPIFPTAPTFSRNIEYIPIYVSTPTGWKQEPYTPSWVYLPGPTADRIVEYEPIFPTAPTFSRGTEYTPIFVTAPAGYKSGTYVPKYLIQPTGVRIIGYVPKYSTAPESTRIVEYVPVFKIPPIGDYDENTPAG